MKVSGIAVTDTPKLLSRTVSVGNLVWDRRHNNAYLKIKGYPIYVEDRDGLKTPVFTKIFKDDVLLDYIDGWEYGTNTTGSDTTLVDNILIHDATGSNYRIEYTELYRNICPSLALNHSDSRKNRMIPSRFGSKIIWSFERISDFNYSIVYANADGGDPKTISKTFSNIVYVKEFDYNSDMTPWRLEIFALNAKRNRRTTSPASNTDLIPRLTTFTNSAAFDAIKEVQMVARLRNTETNVVTNWSDRFISIRRYCLWRRGNGTADTRVGNYYSLRLI